MILVTGGTGFLGAYIIQELIHKGYAVRATRRNGKIPFFISKEVVSKVDWVEGDILDTISLEEAMHGVDTVIHSAAKVSFSKKERKEMYATNITGTANIVNLALDKKIKRFVYISSVSAIGRTGNRTSVDENSPWENNKGNSHYGITKYHAEMEVWRGEAEGLSTVIINPSTVLGYGDWNQSSCAIFRNIFNEFPWYTTGTNGFVDVKDVARAAVDLMAKDFRGERFILSAKTLSFHQLFDLIADWFSKRRPNKEATAFLSGLAWRIEKLKSILTGKPTLLSKETARIARSHMNLDNSKILRFLPEFYFTPLEKTVQDACQSYLEQPQPA